jgi:acyl-CoA dehydrogenase
MVDMGWPGLLVPEAYGGLDFGYLGAGVLFEEIGRHLSVAPLLSTGVLAVTAVRAGADEVLKQQLLPGIVSGELLLALALQDAPHGDLLKPSARARSDGSGEWVVDGVKNLVIDGATAKQLLVSCVDDDGEPGLFLVDAGGPCVAIKSQLLVDSHRVASVRFEGAPASARLAAAPGGGAALLGAVLNAGSACVAAELLGLANEAFSRTLEYLRTRKQFGVQIGRFQGLQHRCAHLFCELELARSTVLRALAALDSQDPDAARWASLAKNKSGRVARLAAQEAIQMHGGIGMTDEFDIGFFLKRARALETQLGDTDYHADRFARALGF